MKRAKNIGSQDEKRAKNRHKDGKLIHNITSTDK
jgi:hypothetical protein